MKATTEGGMKIVGTIIAVAVVVAVLILVFVSGGGHEDKAGQSHLQTPATTTQP